jgi:hypothetical protein
MVAVIGASAVLVTDPNAIIGLVTEGEAVTGKAAAIGATIDEEVVAGTTVLVVPAGTGEASGAPAVALGSVGLVLDVAAVVGTAGAASAAATVGSTAGVAVAGVAVVLASSKGSQTPDAMLTNRQTNASMSRGRHHGCRVDIDIVL